MRYHWATFVQQELGKLGPIATVPAEQGQLMGTGKLTWVETLTTSSPHTAQSQTHAADWPRS